MYAEVVIPLPLTNSYTYIVPAFMGDHICTGCRVEVPFSGRKLAGVVLELHERETSAECLEIADLLDDAPTLPQGTLDLYRWISSYYFAPLGEVLLSGLPPGVLSEKQILVTLGEQGKKLLSGLPVAGLSDLSPAQEKKAVEKISKLEEKRGKKLASWLKQSGNINKEQLALWEKLGLIVLKEKSAGCESSAKTVIAYCIGDNWQEQVEKIAKKAPTRAKILKLAGERGVVTRLDILEAAPNSDAAIKALVKSGWLKPQQVQVMRSPLGHQLLPELCNPGGLKDIKLTEEQSHARQTIDALTAQGSFAVTLLEGVTGSGKTEVYLGAAEKCIEEGKTAILLVPEIAMTPQLLSRVHARFGECVAVLHSGLSKGERLDEWQRVRDGRATVVVGARSAILSPIQNIGLIVVDEEHDPSYKSDDHVLYNARDVAIMRAKMENAVVVLGSATPSLESRHQCECGKYKHIRLTKRATDAPKPDISLVDLKEYWTSRERRLSSELILAIGQRLEADEQTILFLNRRSFAPITMCKRCRTAVECEDCSVPMAYHKKHNYLICHACGKKMPVPEVCPKCGHENLELVGVGTQKIEEELSLTFPKARIARMDQDSIQKKGSMRDILLKMAEGEIDILVGTQMVTKGHDFPGVTLVGVLLADQGLNFPDFRGSERTYQLLTQVAGRSGRHDKPGQVIIQTLRPEHHAVQHALDGDFDAFYEEEMMHREGLYPPYTKLAAVRVESVDPQAAFDLSRDMANELKKICSEESLATQILGPVPAPMRKLRTQYRFRLLIRDANRKNLHTLLRQAYNKGLWKSSKDIKVILDVDPLNML